MANYYPQSYPQNYPQSYLQPSYQQNYPQAATPQSNGIVWVQGLEGAKAYPVASGTSIMLMDSEESVFYIKTTDQSGMPSPLRVFDYTERTEEPQKVDTSEFVTREEFEKKIAELKRKPKEQQKKEAQHE